MHGGGRRHVLQVGLLEPPIACLPQAAGPYPLRERPFDPCAPGIALPSLLTGIPGASRLERFPVRPRREQQATPSVRGTETERSCEAGAAVLEAKADDRIRLALPIDI